MISRKQISLEINFENVTNFKKVGKNFSFFESTIFFSASQNRFLSLVDESTNFFDKTGILELLIKLIFLNRSMDSPEWDRKMELKNSRLNEPFLFIAPRRFGKTLVLHLLEAFFAGTIPQDVLKKLNVHKSDAMEWFGKYCVVNITFGLCSGGIVSLDDCVEACWSILHQTFLKYSYLVPFLEQSRAISFRGWLYEKNNKTIEDISAGIKLLVECMRMGQESEK